MENIKRGDVLLVDLGSGKGSEQEGIRPVLVVSNNVGNTYSNVITVVPITSSQIKRPLPTHVSISKEQYNTPKQSTIMTEQIRTISKDRIIGDKLFSLNTFDTIRLNIALVISLCITDVKCKYTMTRAA